MLGVLGPSWAGSLMKVLQLEHAGRFTGPNIVFSFPNRPRSGRDPKVRRSDEGAEASRPSPPVQWRAVFLGGVRRSFAVLLVISFACRNILVRGLFFPSLSRPVGIGAIWRLTDGAVAIAGAIMYTRE